MYTPVDKAVRVLELLTEGMSVSAVERVTGGHHTTILSLLVQVGERCQRFAIERVRNVRVRDVQADELWSFIQKKEGHKWPHEYDDDTIGDSYTFVGIERNTKLVLCWLVGRRTAIHTEDFISRLRYATADSDFQLTTDDFQPYGNAVDTGLSDRADYAHFIKVYRSPREGEARYSPAEVVDTEVVPVMGHPDPKRICTSHVERQNLTMRMQIRRLTRLTNGFSKTLRNHKAAIALYFCWYNYCRPHRSLRTTPAMAAELTDHIWTIRELIEALP
jgi:IS1 family transposase